jgi:2-haloacid dehalogenase
MPIKGLIFDAYGTLYDVHSVQAKTEELCPGKGDLITQIWRLKQLEYTWLQNALLGYRDFAFVTEASLAFALRAAGVAPSGRITSLLFEKYLDLDPFPEAKDALGALRRRGGLKLAILSNGSTRMLTELVKNSGLDAFLDVAISVDGAKKFKPHPECYALVEKTLGLRNDEVMFVSSNGFDVAGAKHFGFKVVWIRRGGGASAQSGSIGPAQMYRLLRGESEMLGYEQDHTVGALTDLVGLL